MTENEEVSPNDIEYLDGAYERAEAQPGGFERLPDGTYHCRVNGLRFARSSKGAPALFWDLAVVRGNGVGSRIQKITTIQENTLGIIKSDLVLFGIDARPLSRSHAQLSKAVGKIVEVRLQTNTGKDGKQYQNVYFQRLEAGAAPLVEVDEGEIPF